ncbi:MAG: purine-nucleoside phosphorylase [Oscillospiraceae bacterium]|nr:purine-nucleoside phosphorylase [Oscillospiraceae bacterium]
MNEYYERLQKALAAVRERTDAVPFAGVVLGSGLGGLADEIEIDTVIPYSELPGMPVSTVQGHNGRFVFGRCGGVPVVMMQGRVHYYEGYTTPETVMPVRLMGLMGIRVLFLTNAAGGVNWNYHAGDLMLIADQICNVPSPLIGPNIDELGVRFPDMSEIYSKRLRSIVRDTAAENGIPLREGVYIQLGGPNYESPSEVRMVRTLGADAVGMSTATEAIAARHMGLETVGISCISNLACGVTSAPLSHAEVQECADRVAPQFKRLITCSLQKMYKELN